jgi:hypothetical protein
MRRGTRAVPPPTRRFNQRASSLQVNASKNKEKSLHFLSFPFCNWAFSMGYRRKNRKIAFDPSSRIRLWARRLNSIRLCLSLTARRAAESNSFSGNSVAQIPFFVKRRPHRSWLRGRHPQRRSRAAGDSSATHTAWIAGRPGHNAAMVRPIEDSPRPRDDANTGALSRVSRSIQLDPSSERRAAPRRSTSITRPSRLPNRLLFYC